MINDAILAMRDVAWAATGLFAALISAAVAAWGGIRFGLIPGVKAAKRTIVRLDAAATIIDAQLKHDGGLSLIDTVNSIHTLLQAECPLFDPTGAAKCPYVAGVTKHSHDRA